MGGVSASAFCEKNNENSVLSGIGYTNGTEENAPISEVSLFSGKRDGVLIRGCSSFHGCP